MAKVLLGWEFGGNRGHVTTLLGIGRALRARGHQVSYALQRLDSISREELDGAELWQAPVTPRLLINTSKGRSGPPATMGDILVRLGLDDPRLVASLIAGWDRMLDAIRPDLVIADYGPFLLCAARGRVPSMAVGTPFSLPPAEMARFPVLGGSGPAYSEAQALAALNGALETCGRDPLESLPQIFAADRALPGGFAELDPYRGLRTGPLIRPITGGPVSIASGEGEELFVYAPEQIQIEAPLWQGLAQARLPTRVYVSSVGGEYRAALRALGLTVEDGPLPFSEIGRRSRLLLSHGGHGFVCAGLLAGLPQIVCHFDLEKYGIAQAITELGVGGMVALPQIEPKPFAESLVSVYQNHTLLDRAQALAPDFQARNDRPMEQAVADAAERLLRSAAPG